jgi:hypothetical protein
MDFCPTIGEAAARSQGMAPKARERFRSEWAAAFRVVAMVCILFSGADAALAREDEAGPSQADFAVRLATALGLRGQDGGSAVELLSRVGVRPGTGPGASWEPAAPATQAFVAKVQASLQMVLKRVALELSIPPPPTLDLFVFELPPAPQKIVFPAPSKAGQLPGTGGAGGGTPPSIPTEPGAAPQDDVSADAPPQGSAHQATSGIGAGRADGRQPKPPPAPPEQSSP